MKQESGTYVFKTLDRTSQERLLVFGIMATTETANEGRMHAGRMVQEIRTSSQRQRGPSWPSKSGPLGRLVATPSKRPSEIPQRPRNRRISDRS